VTLWPRRCGPWRCPTPGALGIGIFNHGCSTIRESSRKVQHQVTFADDVVAQMGKKYKEKPCHLS
jgi:hypothetical protein